MKGNETFKVAVKAMADVSDGAADGAGLHARADRPLHPAPGQPAHHRRGRRAAEDRPEQGLQERRPLRQHVGGVDPDRARRVRPRGPARDRRPRAAHRVRRGPRVGQRPAALVRRSDRPMSTLALLFPGQGSQSVGMGKALCEASAGGARRLRRGGRGARLLALEALLRGAGGGAAADGQHAAGDPDALDRGARGSARALSASGSRARSSRPAIRSASTRPTSPPARSRSPTRCALVRARGDVHAGGRAGGRRRDGRDRGPGARGRRGGLPRGGAGRDRRARQLQLARADGDRRACRRRRARLARRASRAAPSGPSRCRCRRPSTAR